MILKPLLILASFTIAVLATPVIVRAQAPESGVLVTPDNFRRAETDMYFALFAKRGAFGKFFKLRELPLEGTGVRPNRDTLYGEAIFDLDAGPVTLTMPDAGKRFMSLMIIDQDHYVHGIHYGKGSYTLTRKDIGTRYVFAATRTLVNPVDANDMRDAHALQDAVAVKQASPGKFEAANWNEASQKKVRDALIALNDTLPDLRNAFGAKKDVDPVRHLIGTASAWGGNPDKDAIYVNVTPDKNDGTIIYKLTVPAVVPVNSFWSVIVYTADGHLQKNQYDVYSLNSITVKKSGDGSAAIQFGGCDGKIENCIPTMPGWNYMVRLYRPRAEVLSGRWKFPDAKVAN